MLTSCHRATSRCSTRSGPIRWTHSSKQCPDDVPCRVQDAELWFAETPAELEQAKAFCRHCPARLACLAGALERREPWGVWGGEIFERGTIVARKRPRGRPRKADRTEVAA